MVKFGFAVSVRGEEAVLNELELASFDIDAHAGGQADAGNYAMGVTRTRLPNQPDALAVVLVDYRVVKQDVAPRA